MTKGKNDLLAAAYYSEQNTRRRFVVGLGVFLALALGFILGYWIQ